MFGLSKFPFVLLCRLGEVRVDRAQPRRRRWGIVILHPGCLPPTEQARHEVCLALSQSFFFCLRLPLPHARRSRRPRERGSIRTAHVAPTPCCACGAFRAERAAQGRRAVRAPPQRELERTVRNGLVCENSCQSNAAMSWLNKRLVFERAKINK
jgi:hypothetical protein